MKLITQTGSCDVCGIIRGLGNHAECAKKRQQLYADIKRPKGGKKKDVRYVDYDPTGGQR